jgi:hypothetical protein
MIDAASMRSPMTPLKLKRLLYGVKRQPAFIFDNRHCRDDPSRRLADVSLGGNQVGPNRCPTHRQRESALCSSI